MKICSVDGCEKKAVRKGMCQSHHDKVRRHGDPLWKRELLNQCECSIEGCTRKAHKRGLCNAHYIRIRRFGRVHRVLAKPGEKRFNESGYEVKHINGHFGRSALVHRLVMEAYLDRPLDDFEIVHHINGNRFDNRIENLELCNQSNHTEYHSKARKGTEAEEKMRKKKSQSLIKAWAKRKASENSIQD